MALALAALGGIALGQGGPAWKFAENVLAEGAGTNGNQELGFVHAPYRSGSTAVMQYFETTAGGACWADFDRDGKLDIYVTNTLGPTGAETSKLYKGTGASFSDVTVAQGVGLKGVGQACAWGDYDNDGWPDLYVTFAVVDYSHQGNVLFRNTGGGGFVDVTRSANVDAAHDDPFDDEYACRPTPEIEEGIFLQRCWSMSPAWLDFDLDGDLDLYVTQYARFPEEPSCIGVPNPDKCRGQPNRLFRNEGDGTFVELAGAMGVAFNEDQTRGRSLAVVASDIDGNGWPDLYVTNDQDANALYLNSGGTFSSVAKARGASNYDAAGTPRAGMGIDAQDFNNDGSVDLLSTHLSNQRDAIYLGSESGTFTDVHETWLQSGDVEVSRWGGGYVDLNVDGRKDYLVVRGGEGQPQPGIVSLQLNEGTQFGGIETWPSGAEINTQNHRSAAFADYDNDGDLDVYVGTLQETNGNEGRPKLIRFNYFGGVEATGSPAANWNWLRVSLVGTDSARDAIGAKVKVTTAGEQGWSQWLWKTSGGSYAGNNDPRLLFGLKTNKTGTIEVTWPGGAVQTQSFTIPANANKLELTLTEPNSRVPVAVRWTADPVADATSVTLDWSTNIVPDFAKYRVYVQESPTFDASAARKVDVAAKRDSHARIDGLDQETDYWFWVSVIDAGGFESPLTSALAARTTHLPPAPVTLAAPANVTASSVDLSWSAATTPIFKAYEVHRATTADFAPSARTRVASLASIDATKHRVTGLLDATTYHFRVVVNDTDGLTGVSAAKSATTPNAIPPAPTLLPATGISNGNVTLRWQASTLHDFAKIEATVYDAAAAETWTGSGVATVTSASARSVGVAGLKDNAEYKARLRITDLSGATNLSNVVTFRTKDAPPAPVAVHAIPVENVTADGFRVTWTPTAIADFLQYEVRVADEDGALLLSRNLTTRATAAFDVAGLRDATAYVVTVRLRDTEETFSDSAPVAVRTRNAPPPALATPRVAYGPDAGQVTLLWSASDAHDFARYEVHVGASESFAFGEGTRQRSLADAGATRGGVVAGPGASHARVLVFDAGGLSSASPAVALGSTSAVVLPRASVASPAPRVASVAIDFPETGGTFRGFRVHEGRSTASPSLATVAPTERSIALSNVVPGEACFVVVAEFDKFELWSRPACASVRDGTAEDARGALLVQRVTVATGERSAEISWWSPERTTSRVDVGPRASALAPAPAPGAPVAEGAGWRTTLRLDGLAPGTTYFFVVRSTAADGFAAGTSPREFATLADRTAPAPPASVRVSGGREAVTVAWDASPSADVAGYLVYRSEGAEPFALVATALAPASSWVDESPPQVPASGGTREVRYRVAAVDEARNAASVDDAAEARVILQAPLRPAPATAREPEALEATSEAEEAEPTTDLQARSAAQAPAPGAFAALAALAALAIAARRRARR